MLELQSAALISANQEYQHTVVSGRLHCDDSKPEQKENRFRISRACVSGGSPLTKSVRSSKSGEMFIIFTWPLGISVQAPTPHRRPSPQKAAIFFLKKNICMHRIQTVTSTEPHFHEVASVGPVPCNFSDVAMVSHVRAVDIQIVLCTAD